MSRPKTSGRTVGTRVRKRKQRRVRKVPTGGKTIEQFCATWALSRSTYNRNKDAGIGPAEMQPGGPHGRIIITPAAEAEWVRQHTRRPNSSAASDHDPVHPA